MSGEMINAILDSIEESTDYYNYRARNARTARAELAQLRAASAERDALRARVAELEAQHAATLRPRKCDTCHGVQMAEEMRESCAAAVRKLAHMNSAYEDAIRSLPIPVCNPLAPKGDQ